MSIDSPCIGICRLDSKDQFCVGCFRSLEEIGRWSQMNNGQRLEVLAVAAQRRKATNPCADEPKDNGGR